MSNIVLSEKELKMLLIATLKQSGLEVEDIHFSQKLQLFGPNRGMEINAEIVKKPSADDLTTLLNKLTYQDQNRFTPVQQPAVQQPVAQQPGFGQQAAYQQPQFTQPAGFGQQPQFTQQPNPNYAFGQSFEG